jgi:hypothetical protein
MVEYLEQPLAKWMMFDIQFEALLEGESDSLEKSLPIIT